MKTFSLFRFFAAIACLLIASTTNALAETNATKVLIVVGPSNHPPGSHEPAAGARVIEHCLENMENRKPIQADVIHEWPTDGKGLDHYASIVFIGDQFPGERLKESERAMKDIAAMMKRGCGIVCIHYGVGLGNDDVATDGDHPLLHWMGGYFATRCDHHQSKARIYPAARIEPADPRHPIANGWKPFTLRDEPYINNYFGPNHNHLLPGAFAVATSMLPPDNPSREIIAWGVNRPDGGRGTGITLPHFYKNWELEPLRKFILNAITWTAHQEVPNEGIQTSLPDLKTFNPISVEFIPRKKK